jgi:hypothetical protein
MSMTAAAKAVGGDYPVNRRSYQRHFGRLTDLKLVRCFTVNTQKFYKLTEQLHG